MQRAAERTLLTRLSHLNSEESNKAKINVGGRFVRVRLNYIAVLIASGVIAAVILVAANRMTGQTAGQTSGSAQATRAAQPIRAARMPDGHPNLNGIWQALLLIDCR